MNQGKKRSTSKKGTTASSLSLSHTHTHTHRAAASARERARAGTNQETLPSGDSIMAAQLNKAVLQIALVDTADACLTSSPP